MAKKINIGFSGITRNTDDELSKDGECMELINARIKDGSIQPIGNPILVASLTKKYKAGYYHALANKYLMIRSSDGGVDAYSSDFSSFSILSTDISNVSRIEIVGNIICLLKSDAIEYCLYTDGIYKYLGTRPQIPKLKITYDAHVENIITSTEFNVRVNTELKNSIEYNAIGYISESMARLNKKGCFLDRILVRFGLRMFDGSYIYISPTYYIQNDAAITSSHINPYDNKSYSKVMSIANNLGYWALKTESGNTAGEATKWLFSAIGFKPIFNFYDINLSAWKDLIVGIDVFSTVSILNNQLLNYSSVEYQGTATNESGTTDSFYEYSPKSIHKINEDIVDANKFYKIAEYDLEGKLVFRCEDTGDSSVSLEKVLEDDQMSTFGIAANVSYMYNSRLHLGDITTYYKRVNDDLFLSPLQSSQSDTSTYVTGTVSVYLNTDRGVVILKQTASIPDKISPYVMYPDNRAYKMVICRNGKRFEYALNKNKYSNIASAVIYAHYVTYSEPDWNYSEERFNDYLPINSIPTKDSTGTELSWIYYRIIPFDVSTWSDGTDDIVEQNISVYRPNVLKVSELNNPFVFPSKTTYQPSTRKVIGMCSNTTALSQGQFGEHPLYVFCEDGIYAMTVGTDVVYATSKPMNRLVLNNSNSLRGLDQAVVFSTEQGIMLMSGTEVDNISGVINGYLPSSVDSSPIIPKIMKVAGLDTCISTSEFKDYCVNSEIGFNYREREIIISNPSYPYSYVYSMNTKTWSKMSIKIATYINAYPDILAMVSDSVTSIYNIDNNHRSVSKIAVVTRPIKMGTTTLKRILQSAMRAVIKRSLSDLYLRGEPVKFRGDDLTIFSDVGFYVLGSNDAEHYILIAGKEKMVDIRDLITKMNKSKPYKYFMFCLVGGVRTDVAINFVECIVDESFTNRLR